jgi:hypothetical protein
MKMQWWLEALELLKLSSWDFLTTAASIAL